MPDVVTTRSHQGYFSRVANSFIGVLIGFLMIPGSVLLIGWNEYRTIHRTKGLLEAEKVVVEVADAMTIQPEQNGKLVHFSGQATTEETLKDQDFAISRVALRLARDVEMYQWVEKKESRTRDKLGGGRETVTTYEYSKRWSNDRENSESFHEPTGHTNPPLRFHSQKLTAQNATVGAFKLDASQVEQIGGWQDLTLEEASLLPAVNEADNQKYLVHNNELLIGAEGQPSTESPKVGDLRIRFRAVEPMVISVLSQQDNQKLKPFRTSNGESVESIDEGERTSAEMFTSLRAQNTTLAWILRGVGWLLACVGFGLITGPLSTLASVIPFLGRIAGTATFAISLVMGSVVSLTAIGVAWIAVRPIWAIGFFAIAAAGLWLLFRKPKPKQPPLAQLV